MVHASTDLTTGSK